MKPETLTADRLRELLHYDPETGAFTWKLSPSRSVRAGSAAGSLHRTRYWNILISRKQYAAHRLAWLYMTGEFPAGPVDHRNRTRSDNSWANLRLASVSENARNRKVRSDCSSGHTGVVQRSNSGKWQAYIGVERKLIHLGTFESEGDAMHARKAAEAQYFGEFAPA